MFGPLRFKKFILNSCDWPKSRKTAVEWIFFQVLPKLCYFVDFVVLVFFFGFYCESCTMYRIPVLTCGAILMQWDGFSFHLLENFFSFSKDFLFRVNTLQFQLNPSTDPKSLHKIFSIFFLPLFHSLSVLLVFPAVIFFSLCLQKWIKFLFSIFFFAFRYSWTWTRLFILIYNISSFF